MEREGREGRGRREGEMRRGRRGEMRKGIVIGGIAILLVLGCNNGGELEAEKKNQFLSSLANLGNDFLGVFTSFGDMFTETLGFKADTKKSEVATYFQNVQSTLENTKKALNKIVDDMKAQENSNATGVETAVKTLNEKLTTIIEGAKTASGAIGEASESLGNVDTGDKGGAAGSKIDELVGGIKAIVKVVLKDNEGNAEAGDAKQATDLESRSGDTTAGRLFASDNAGSSAKKAAADAAKAVGAVTGADILQAISTGVGGKAATLAKYNQGNGTGGNGKNDAVIAGAIALRAMAKEGKFANKTGGDDITASVKGSAVSAVTKALDTLTIAIRKTIDKGLKDVKDAMKINVNDTPATTESKS